MATKQTELLREIGRITAELHRAGLKPAVIHGKEVKAMAVKYTTVIKITDGFSRSSLEAGGDSTTSMEDAYLNALLNFWQGLTGGTHEK